MSPYSPGAIGPRPHAPIRRLATDWHDGQNSASPRPQISGLFPAIPFRQEGRSRVVTNAGWDVVDARASARVAGARRVVPRERVAGEPDERRVLPSGKTPSVGCPC